jgi:capsular polysaccharide biosynthesis protein
MELRRYFNLIRRRVALVIVAVIVGGLAGYLFTSRTPSYTATATIYVGTTDLAADQQQLSLQSGLNEVVATFASMIPSPVIAQHALDKTHIARGAGAVAASTSATVVFGTDLINVAVTDAKSEDAVRLANGVSNAFISQISQYQSTTPAAGSTAAAAPGSVPNEPAYVFQDATAAVRSSSGVERKMLLGALFGLIISILLIFLLDYLDITIKSAEELERRVGLPVLGIVPLFGTLQLGAGSQGPAGRAVGGQAHG